MSDFYAPWIEDPDDPNDTEDDFLNDFNPNHAPAGNEHGGEFTSGHNITPGDDSANPYKQYMTDEMYRRMKNAIAVAKALPETYKIEGPQRDLMRQQITDKLYNRNIDQRVQGREATIILGLPGAGKSTLANPLIKNGAIEIDPDIVKQEIPEFNGGIGANAVHEESSMINKQILARAIAHGDNIVWPRIDGTDKLKKDIQTLKDNGYKVHVAIIDVSQETAIRSAVDRFEHTGRLVSPSTILEYGDTPTQSYNIAKGIEGVTVARYKREHGQGVEAVLGDGVLQVVRDGVVVAEYAARDFTIKLLDMNPNHDPDNGRFTSGAVYSGTTWHRDPITGRKKYREHKQTSAQTIEHAKKYMQENHRNMYGWNKLANTEIHVENVKKVRDLQPSPKFTQPRKGSEEWKAREEMQKRYDELQHKGD